MRCGDCVLMPTGGPQSIPHLWFVITEPQPDEGLCVIVSLTTLRHDRDQTMLLNVGDHPFIRHASIVLYSDAQIAAGTIAQLEACSTRVLKLIQDGARQSPHTPKKILTFCRNAWGR